MEKYLFISYSSQDKTVADAICHFLEEKAIPCWMAPRDIMPGSTWASAIIKAIRGCTAMLLIYSKSSNDSGQVANEVDKAFSNGKTIIPFMMDSTPLNDDFDYYLSRKHWLIAYPDYRVRFADLFDVVSKLVPPYTNIEGKEDVYERDQYKVSSRVDDSSVVKTDGSEAIVVPEEKISITVDREPDKSPFNPKWSTHVTEAQKSVILVILGNMVKVEGGKLKLGATDEQLKWAHKDEKPAHMVEMSTYWICKYQVTQKEWENIMGSNPCKRKEEKCPVENVSLLDCREFVKKLGTLSGVNFGLPTEAQWEFAARGGIRSKGYVYAGSDSLKEVGWFFGTEGQIHPVGLLKPNELGLYDMSGNIEEWCDEKKGRYFSEEIKDPHNIYKPGFWDIGYVYRGGSYFSKRACRVSHRAAVSDDYKSDAIGLRLVINLK